MYNYIIMHNHNSCIITKLYNHIIIMLYNKLRLNNIIYIYKLISLFINLIVKTVISIIYMYMLEKYAYNSLNILIFLLVFINNNILLCINIIFLYNIFGDNKHKNIFIYYYFVPTILIKL